MFVDRTDDIGDWTLGWSFLAPLAVTFACPTSSYSSVVPSRATCAVHQRSQSLAALVNSTASYKLSYRLEDSFTSPASGLGSARGL